MAFPLLAGRGRMSPHLVVGRVAGVPIGVTPWLVVVGLVLLAVASLGAPRPALALAGLGVVVVGSLLVHELAHGIVARASGFDLDGVVLGVTGGLVAYRGEPPSAAVEIRIAAAGPAASAVVAAGAALLEPVAPVGGLADLLFVAAWLNLANAVVNLVPLPSLDGARIAGAILRGRRERAGAVPVESSPAVARSLEP